MILNWERVGKCDIKMNQNELCPATKFNATHTTMLDIRVRKNIKAVNEVQSKQQI